MHAKHVQICRDERGSPAGNGGEAAAGHSGETGNPALRRDFDPWGPDIPDANPRCADARLPTGVSEMVEVVLSRWTWRSAHPTSHQHLPPPSLTCTCMLDP